MGTVYERNKKVRTVDTEVVLVDIESFSLMSAIDQVTAAVLANGELEKVLAISSGQSALKVEEVVAGIVTTGDGFYVILQPGIKGYGLALGLSLRTALLHSTKVNRKYFPGIRVGVHRGTLSEFIDAAHHENYVGPVMNDCARLLGVKPDEAPQGFLEDKNYVVCSKTAFETFDEAYSFAGENSYFKALGVKISPWRTITDKHKIKHEYTFVESSRHAAFNPPKPPDFEARLRKGSTTP